MVRRIAHPGKPIILVDLGPGLATHHRYDLMRRTLDVALAERLAKGDREEVRLEKP
jgi:hypothetical protein